MALPETVHVKISSEAAAAVSITAVVAQQMPAPDLVEHILRVTGKDAARIHDILQQGVVVSGASRLRWPPIDAALDEIARALEVFPDSLPGRPFDPSRCIRAALAGGRSTIELTRDVASQKRFLHRRSFWLALMETAAGLAL
ncbi:MAG TPA: hypothetical protein VEU62_14655, partial [Bryobacterales bacterium]|nr:hypothetical protein [Bryobacterales bacterium]